LQLQLQLRLPPDPPKLHKQAAVLHDIYPGASQSLSRGVVTNAKLKPD
jgi:hypothetical protein